MDLESRYQTILNTYRMSGWDEKLHIARLKNEIRTNLIPRLQNKSVIIFGAGKNTKELLLLCEDFLDIAAILDSNTAICRIEAGTHSYPVDRPETLSTIAADIILISSFSASAEMEAEVKKYAPHMKTIDPYVLLRERGIYLLRPFYADFHPYYSAIELRYEYAHAQTRQQAQAALKSLISYLASIHDILGLKAALSEYIRHDFTESSVLKQFYEDLSNLEQEVRTVLSARKQPDILWFWMDQVNACAAKRMPFLQSLQETGLHFENAFTETPVTMPVYRNIFFQQSDLDDFGERRHECVFARTLEKYRYQFHYCGVKTDAFRGQLHNIDFDLLAKDCHGNTNWQLLANLYWNILTVLVKEQAPVLLLCHTYHETHSPFLSPDTHAEHVKPIAEKQYYVSNIEDNPAGQLRRTEGLMYADRELAWLFSLLPSSSNRIVMGDHGYHSQGWRYDANHIYFNVTGPGITPHVCKKYFSLIRFKNVIDWLLTRTETAFDEIFQTEGKIQRTDIRSENWIDYLIKNGKRQIGMAYRGMQSTYDRYVLLRDGEEFYHRFPDETQNEIFHPAYQKRIRQLREKTGKDFFDMNQDERFVYAKRLYDYGSGVDDCLVSVIIPAYNAEAYLPRCLQSVLGQTYRKLEVLLFDDASTDKTAEIAQEWACRDNRLLYSKSLRQQGPGALRNLGVERSRGQYIIFLDSDDWWEQTLVETCLNTAKTENADLVLFDYYEIDGIAKRLCKHNYFPIPGDAARLHPELISSIATLSQHELFCKRELYIKYQIHTPSSDFEDTCMLPILAACATRIAYTKNALYYYFSTPNSRSKTLEELKKANIVLQYVTEEFKRRGLYDFYYKQLSKFLGTFLYTIRDRLKKRGQYTPEMQNLYDALCGEYAKLFPNKNIPQRKQFIVWGSYNLRSVILRFLCFREDLIEHYSFSGIISAVSTPVKLHAQHPNPYRNEMVRKDLLKAWIKYQGSSDYFAIDFLEERLPILPYGTSYITGGEAFAEANPECADSTETYLELGGRTCETIWKQACLRFIDILLQRFRPQQIILVKTFLMDGFGDYEVDFPFDEKEKIQEKNRVLLQRYQFFENNCPGIKVVDTRTFTTCFTDRNFPFGCYPHHANDFWFTDAASRIEKVMEDDGLAV